MAIHPFLLIQQQLKEKRKKELQHPIIQDDFSFVGPTWILSNHKGKDARVLIMQIPTCGVHMDATQIPYGHLKIDQVLIWVHGYQFFQQLVQ